MDVVSLLLGALLVIAGAAVCLACQWATAYTTEWFGETTILEWDDDADDLDLGEMPILPVNGKAPDPSLN